MPLLDAPQVGDDSGLRNLLRRVGDLETLVRQVAAASSGSQGQLDFLAGQTVSAEASPGAATTITTNPAIAAVSTTWVEFDPTADAAVTLTTSSTGRIAIQAGGFLWMSSYQFAAAYGYIGIEILDGAGAQVRPPANGDGNFSSIWGSNNALSNASSGHRHEWLLTPNTAYALRCRRGYGVGAGLADAIATTAFQGTAISVTKLGM